MRRRLNFERGRESEKFAITQTMIFRRTLQNWDNASQEGGQGHSLSS